MLLLVTKMKCYEVSGLAFCLITYAVVNQQQHPVKQ